MTRSNTVLSFNCQPISIKLKRPEVRESRTFKSVLARVRILGVEQKKSGLWERHCGGYVGKQKEAIMCNTREPSLTGRDISPVYVLFKAII